MTVATQVLVEGPRLLPYSSLRLEACPACGFHLTLMDHIVGAFKGSSYAIHQIRFCPGGKTPEEECPGGILQDALIGKHRHINECAGINEAHLHIACIRCGYKSLIRTRTRS